MKAKIAKDIRSLAVPLDDLKLLPGNPHKGDVEAVAASYKRFGQQKPIVVMRDPADDKGTILAGNTQYKAARLLGWTHIAASWQDSVEDDPEEGWDENEAVGFAVTDNHTAELGEDDPEALMAMLDKIQDDDELFDATGYDIADLQEISEQVEVVPVPEAEEPDVVGNSGASAASVIQTYIVFDNEHQQQNWFKFVRWVKRVYPDGTLSSKIDQHIQTVLPAETEDEND